MPTWQAEGIRAGLQCSCKVPQCQGGSGTLGARRHGIHCAAVNSAGIARTAVMCKPGHQYGQYCCEDCLLGRHPVCIRAPGAVVALLLYALWVLELRACHPWSIIIWPSACTGHEEVQTPRRSTSAWAASKCRQPSAQQQDQRADQTGYQNEGRRLTVGCRVPRGSSLSRSCTRSAASTAILSPSRRSTPSLPPDLAAPPPPLGWKYTRRSASPSRLAHLQAGCSAAGRCRDGNIAWGGSCVSSFSV